MRRHWDYILQREQAIKETLNAGNLSGRARGIKVQSVRNLFRNASHKTFDGLPPVA